MCIYIYIHIHTYIYAYVSLSLSIYIYIHICVHKRDALSYVNVSSLKNMHRTSNRRLGGVSEAVAEGRREQRGGHTAEVVAGVPEAWRGVAHVMTYLPEYDMI